MSKLRGNEDEVALTMGERFKSIMRMATNKRMLWFLPQLLWTGVSIAYYSGILVTVISESVVGSAEQQ